MKASTDTALVVLVEPEIAVRELKTHLTGFWAADKWDMAHCPLLPPDTVVQHTFIEFNHPSALLNTELKYACWRKFNGGGWSPKAGRPTMARVRAIVRFLREQFPEARSLMDKGLDDWVRLFEAYLNENGLWHISKVTYTDKSQNVRVYQSTNDDRVSALRTMYRMVQDGYDARPEHEKDIWDVRKMGVTLSPADVSYTLSFTNILQPWLRQVAKQYIRYRLTIHSVSSCLWILNTLNHFSAFLESLQRPISPPDIDRTLVTEFFGYLASVQPKPKARQQIITQLRMFLETCAREGWANFPEKRLIFDEDIPKRSKSLPRPIPEEVMEQLNQHLDALSEPYKTMVIVLQECGMRVSELCSLALDCLVQDQEGDWFLRYFQWKMKKEHSIPITQNLAEVIQAQQQAVKAKWGDKCLLLFPAPSGKRVAKNSFARFLNQLAVDKEIRDATGRLFRFHAHAFRHTVATRMLRGGVKQHHVQKYLGHESPEMTMIYAQITDQDLKKAFQEYQSMAVDITGKVVAADQTGVDSLDLQWFKKNIMAQALPHGFCALPVIAEPCPVPNACLTCANFRTNSSFLGTLKAELDTTEKIIDVARSRNWTRQIEMNERVAANLRKVIGSLEVLGDDTPKKC